MNTLRGSEEEIVSLTFDSTGEELFGLSGDWVLRAWSWRPMPDIEQPPLATTRCGDSASAAQARFCQGSDDGTIIVFDTATRQPKFKWKAHPQTALASAASNFPTMNKCSQLRG